MSAPRSSLRMLLSCAGRRVALLEAFRSAADELGIALEIVASDVAPEYSAACHRADSSVTVPRADSGDFVPYLLDLVRSRDIGMIVPTIDPELLPLAEARSGFAELGAEVAVSAPGLVAMAGDKLATAAFLAEHGVPSPTTATLAQALAAPGSWPGSMFVKPQFGSAGRGVRAVASHAALAGLEAAEPMLVQKLLRGEEYTVNMFFDARGKLVTAVPHRRISVRAGEVEKGVTVREAGLLALAEQLAAVLPEPRGAMCFQAMVDSDGSAAVFEINARFGGGYPLAHSAGAPFARWLLEERLGLPSSANNHWRSGVTMLRYDAAVIVAP